MGRLLAVLLSLSFFVSGSLKVGLCLPRPPAPPALRLSEEDRDWAWPSNHALVGTTFPWFIWLYTSAHYDFSFSQSIILLMVLLTWNIGVVWSRVYLGVHSPCDVLGGWTLGVFILFIFGGFATKLDALYTSATLPSDFASFTLIPALLLAIHPRAWPETQSFGESVCVLSGSAAIWSGRALGFMSGETPFLALAQIDAQASLLKYLLRMIIGLFLILFGRIVVKRLSLALFSLLYSNFNISFYSYSNMCKRLNKFQDVTADKIPWDIDIPVKVVVYFFVGFMLSEGCPAIFATVGI